MNYEMIYKIRPLVDKIHEKNRAVDRARVDVETAELDFRAACARVSGVEVKDLYFSNNYCVADGIRWHVYHIVERAPNGSPKNKCIFCGCDNYEDGVS